MNTILPAEGLTSRAPASRPLVRPAAIERGGCVDIVRVIARLNVGGPAQHVIAASDALADRYATSLVFGDVDASEADMSAAAYGARLHVHRIPELGRRLRPWHDAVAFVRLVRHLRRVRPRVVHTHTAKAGTLGRLAAVVAGVPVRVHTFHGHVFHGYFGRLGTRAVRLAERVLARLTTRVVAISESQAAELATHLGIARTRVAIVPLGLPLGRFVAAGEAERRSFRRELGVSDDTIVVSIVGRLVPVKDHDLLLDAAARVCAADGRFRFVVVGGGPERARLEAKAASLGLRARVSFLGWRDDLERVYAGSDIVALTSRNEGTPVSLIEALAAGRPVVATAVGGVPDVLEQGRLGVLVPAGEAAAFAAALVSLAADGVATDSFARLGPASVLARYSVERLAADLGALYDELLAAHQADRPTRNGAAAR